MKIYMDILGSNSYDLKIICYELTNEKILVCENAHILYFLVMISLYILIVLVELLVIKKVKVIFSSLNDFYTKENYGGTGIEKEKL